MNTIQPAVGATHAGRRVGRGIGSGLGKRVVVVIKVKRAGLVGFIRWVSRVVKCPCNDASLKEVLNL